MTMARRTFLAAAAAFAARRARAAGAFGGAMTLAREVDRLRSLVIVHDGAIAAAEAFRGPALDRAVNVKSVSKTLLSTLAGAALERGEIPSLDTPVAPYLKRMIPRRGDPRLRTITLRHVLAMQSGLAPMAGSTYGAWVSGPHWVYDALAAPMRADPGTVRLYSTANTHILGVVLARAANLDLLDLANARLGAALDIRFAPWTRDPQGHYLGGNDMAMSPLAMARYGEAYRAGGTWGGARIATPDWIDTCWTPRTEPDTPGHRYGLTWFLWDVGGVRVAYARGFGGQMIYVVPERALTVAMTSDPARPARVDGHIAVLHALLSAAILPAAG
ncbi:class C beta-lactamase-related serine hydrolase [Rhodobacteraceae bacterium CCMM004]|nr:class C beta-lactamase-related serine hydrolase [Rhodobacteraceae bacterium CCMM004]